VASHRFWPSSTIGFFRLRAGRGEMRRDNSRERQQQRKRGRGRERERERERESRRIWVGG
jgi:hypothetical protein